jgi:hypothetical protein
MATHLANEETTEKKMRNNSIINQLLCPIRMTCKWQAREALCETHVSKFNWMLILSGRTTNKKEGIGSGGRMT